MWSPELFAERLFDAAAPRVAAFTLLSFRSMLVFAIAPWPGNLVPLRIRAMLAFTIAIVATSALPGALAIAGDERSLVAAFITELVYASALGFGLWAAIGALSACGQIGGLQMGFGLRSSFDPATESTMNDLAQLAVIVWFPIALELGLHHHLIRALSIPPAIGDPAGAGELVLRAGVIGEAALEGSARMFALAIVGAGPIFGLAMLSHAGLGAISRAVPNAMVIGEALGAAAVLGMVAVGVSAVSWPNITERSLLPILEAITRG